MCLENWQSKCSVIFKMFYCLSERNHSVQTKEWLIPFWAAVKGMIQYLGPKFSTDFHNTGMQRCFPSAFFATWILPARAGISIAGQGYSSIFCYCSSWITAASTCCWRHHWSASRLGGLDVLLNLHITLGDLCRETCLPVYTGEYRHIDTVIQTDQTGLSP